VQFSWRYDFAVMLAFGVTTLAGSWKLMAETNRHRDPLALNPWRMVETFGTLLRDPLYVCHTLAVTSVFVGLYAYISISSFVVIEVLGVPVEDFGYAFAGPVACFMAGSTIATRLAHRVPIERTIRVGTVLGILGGAAVLTCALLRVHTVAAVVGPAAIMAFAQGLVLPNSSALALHGHPKVAGSASALLGFAQLGVGSLGGWLAGLLYDGGTLTLALFMAGGWAATGITQLVLMRVARRRAAAS